MAYTIDDFPFSTDKPQIEVTLPVGTHVLELVVEDSAGLQSNPDTIVVTVEKDDVPDAAIDSIAPASGLAGTIISAEISGTGLSEATGVTFYNEVSIIPLTLATGSITRGLTVVDKTITAEIRKRGPNSILVDITIDETSTAGTRTFTVTTPGGVITSKTLTFTVTRRIPTVTITRPTITIPTITIPTATLTIPTATITRPTATLTIPTATITRPTATLTIPTATITRPTATLTIPTATITRPTATLTIPTATITRPTATLTIPTVTSTLPTMTLTRPTVVLATAATIPTIRTNSLMLTSVKGVGSATADKLTAAGITSVSALASANAKDVAAALGYQDIARAQVLVDEAKKLMG